jgi:hypothetical protein
MYVYTYSAISLISSIEQVKKNNSFNLPFIRTIQRFYLERHVKKGNEWTLQQHQENT